MMSEIRQKAELKFYKYAPKKMRQATQNEYVDRKGFQLETNSNAMRART